MKKFWSNFKSVLSVAPLEELHSSCKKPSVVILAVWGFLPWGTKTHKAKSVTNGGLKYTVSRVAEAKITFYEIIFRHKIDSYYLKKYFWRTLMRNS